jgi:hypothetical protein
MGKMNQLFDTNTLIFFLAGTLPTGPFSESAVESLKQMVRAGYALSFVSRIELLARVLPVPEQQALLQLPRNATVLWANEEIATEAIRIRRDHRLKLPDALIAATAIVHDLELISGNFHDFERVAGLKFRNLFAL